MKKTILAMLSGSILAVLTAQATMASERHHIRTTTRAAATEKFRNSSAYFAPGVAVNPERSGYDGALGSGIAGH